MEIPRVHIQVVLQKNMSAYLGKLNRKTKPKMSIEASPHGPQLVSPQTANKQKRSRKKPMPPSPYRRKNTTSIPPNPSVPSTFPKSQQILVRLYYGGKPKNQLLSLYALQNLCRLKTL